MPRTYRRAATAIGAGVAAATKKKEASKSKTARKLAAGAAAGAAIGAKYATKKKTSKSKGKYAVASGKKYKEPPTPPMGDPLAGPSSPKHPSGAPKRRRKPTPGSTVKPMKYTTPTAPEYATKSKKLKKLEKQAYARGK